ncbi:hypothetical protein [Isoptericola sp. NPDC056605]|uniref:hypothetical protein n=1 Tax=Isoptericola sp. NPDC056605 TaxID=3345876 RepID=UPI0036863FA2
MVHEHMIPVLFDVNAPTEEEAAQILVDHLVAHLRGAVPTGEFPEQGIEAWWLPQAEHKHIDGNDRDALHLVEQPTTHQDDPSASDVDGRRPSTT